MSKKEYSFHQIENCNLCNEHESNFKNLGKRLDHSQGFRPNKKTGITVSICKCKNCGLIFSNPQPIPLDFQNHYGVSPTQYWTEGYFEISDEYFKKELETLIQLRSKSHHMTFLDIGAGIGKQMKVMTKNGYDSFGIEGSKDFFDFALEKMEISNLKLQNCLLEDANFENDFFDFISFGAVLEHVYDPNKSINKTLKWLKPGGILHIEVPNSNWLVAKILNLYHTIFQTNFTTHLSPMHEPYHLYEFSLKSFEKNAEINNYKILKSEYHVAETMLPKLFDFILKPIMKRTNTGMQLTIWLQKNS